MGLLDIFKRKNNPTSTANGILGPTFLEEFTEHIANPKKLQPHEWRRKLKSTSGQKKFRLHYYGRLHHEHPNLIVATEHAPALVVAVDISSGQEIVLFDGCKHGYNAMFCDEFLKEQIENRSASLVYKDSHGNDVFEITISTFNVFDFDGEFSENVDDKGQIELVDGTKIAFETAKRNGFDVLQIFGSTDDGSVVEIVSEELA